MNFNKCRRVLKHEKFDQMFHSICKKKNCSRISNKTVINMKINKKNT